MYGLGQGRWSHFSAQSYTLNGAHKHYTALLNQVYSESLSSSAMPFQAGLGLHWGKHPPVCAHQRQCMWPKTPAVRSWWGVSFNPKNGLQKLWPLQWTESGIPFGCMQVAVNRRYEASGPAWQTLGSSSSKFHPQSVIFCAPKVSVVHQGKQQHFYSIAFGKSTLHRIYLEQCTPNGHTHPKRVKTTEIRPETCFTYLGWSF